MQKHFYALFAIIVANLLARTATAFVGNNGMSTHTFRGLSYSSVKSLKANLFDDLVSMFSNEPKSMDIDESKRMITIPVNSMKLGGLRFALGLHLMGAQGKKWKTKQADDGVIDMFYMLDETGSLAFTFQDRVLIVDRWGPFPSKKYLEDESQVLHEFLDELVAMTTGDGISEGDMLLELKDNDVIEQARDQLLPRK